MLKIGNLRLAYPTVLSPMASLTDIVFRQLMDEIGCIGYMVTEMVSAEGVRRKNRRTLDMLATGEFKTPQFVQLFGGQPDSFDRALDLIQSETRFSGVDINLGCPVRKITRRGAGASLLKDPPRAARILGTVRKKTGLPLTAKIRLPEDPAHIPEIIRVIEDQGVDALVVHFRRASDRYSDPARWEFARTVRDSIRTVFIGNGDIRTARDGLEKLEIADGIMIGREAIRNPLIFLRIHEQRSRFHDPEGVSRFSFQDIILRLLELIEYHYEPELQLSRLKAYARFLVSGRGYAKKIREKIYTSTSFQEARDHLTRFFPAME